MDLLLFRGGEGILRLRFKIGDLRLLLKDLERLIREPLAAGDSEEDLRLLLEYNVKGDFLVRYDDRRLLNGDPRLKDKDLRDLRKSGDRESSLRRLRDEDLGIDEREQLEEKLLDERLLIDLDLLSVYNSLKPECFHLKQNIFITKKLENYIIINLLISQFKNIKNNTNVAIGNTFFTNKPGFYKEETIKKIKQ